MRRMRLWALLLIVLAISPVTAPFSTYAMPGDNQMPHEGASLKFGGMSAESSVGAVTSGHVMAPLISFVRSPMSASAPPLLWSVATVLRR